MRAVVFAVVALAATATPSLADAIAPAQARDHVGQSVTVEGLVSEVHHAASGNVTFIDLGGRYPNNRLAGVIFSDDAAKFPDVDSLQDKTIDISGTIKLYQGRPEIVLSDPAQIKVK